MARILRWPSLVTLYSGLAFLGFHGVSGDLLLLGSDPVSLAVYASAAILALTLVLGLVSLPLCILALPLRNRIYDAALTCASIIVAAALICGVIAITAVQLNLRPLFALFEHPLGIAALILAALVLGTLAVVKGPDGTGIISRTRSLGVGLLLCAVIVVSVALVVRGRTPVRPTNEAGPHVVLLVLDGMAAHYLRVYNDVAPPTRLDSYLERALVFTHVHTSVPYTNGWFGVLYSGTPTAGLDSTVATADDGRNLMALLQDHGVTARWGVFHQNGIPEGSGARIRRYRGLRSVYLTEHYRWLPRALGLDYHFSIYTEKFAQRHVRAPLRPVFRYLNSYPRSENVFTKILLPELRQLRSRAQPSFIIFHTKTSSGGDLSWGAQVLDEDYVDPLSEIRENDYQYDTENPQQSTVAAEKSAELAEATANLSASVADFLAALEADPELRDTVVVMTADHGSMFHRGRFWYGFHPDEEVLRVPFAVFNSARSGRDDRPFATPDVVQSVLDTFSVPTKLHEGAFSVFGAHRHAVTASLTQRSEVHREQFLVMYENGVKHRFNLHPRGGDRWVAIDPRGYGERRVGQSNEIPAARRSLLAAGMEEFSLIEEDLNGEGE